MEIFKQFRFEAAHRLDHLPDGHKCKHLHGHSYMVRIFLSGPIETKTGFVMDFADLKSVCKPVIDQLDHSYLNEIPGMGHSTCENVSIWIWRRIKPSVTFLSRIEVWETPTSGASYRGEDE
jgi:6-pyruvoyltetrahydropterin/6-carboxytetrahydropterin synthase